MKDRKNVGKAYNVLRCKPENLWHWEMQVDIGNRPMDLIYKTKSFCFEKWSLMEHNDGLVFTLGICMCKGVGEDSGHGIG